MLRVGSAVRGLMHDRSDRTEPFAFFALFAVPTFFCIAVFARGR
jgi:hypothetical protein